jgi:chromosomal replication initiator protein
MSVTAAHFQVEVKDLVGAKRHKNRGHGRQTAMALCRSLLGMSYPALARLFGGKDPQHGALFHPKNHEIAK